MTDEEKRRWKGPAQNASGRGSGRRTQERKVKAYRAKSESSKKWIERQLSDPYVQEARREGYRARAAYKLIEIDQQTHLLRHRRRIIDLGCAPGGWLQVCLKQAHAELAGIDLLDMEPLAGVHFVQGDINLTQDTNRLLSGLSGPPDLVLSDMAANTTGHRQTDSLRTAALAETALHFAEAHLVQNGGFCCKVFQGGATPELMQQLKTVFRTVRHIKPAASRTGSPELFVIGLGFRGHSDRRSDT